MEDIISAISTARGVGGVAIIRISGSGSIALAQNMFYPLKKTDKFESNVMYVGEIDGGDFRDYGMLVVFRAPHSFTGEDTAEFHCHGGLAVTQGILERTFALGARPATNGEFTKRAYVNGKLSLSSCEGLIDMINSESRAEVKAGYYLYREKLCAKITQLQDLLTDVLAEIDADIDYPEELLERVATDKLQSALSSCLASLYSLKSTFKCGSRIKNGVKVAIVGSPNTGKSSILNSLLSYDKAIVTDIAGTTRDVVEGSLSINGIKFILMDTAGIRESADSVEKIGIERSKRALKECDVAMFVMDGTRELMPEEISLKNEIDVPFISVCNKRDIKTVIASDKYDILFSATNDDADILKQKLYDLAIGSSYDVNADMLTEERHYIAVNNAISSLEKAKSSIGKVSLDLIEYDIKDGWSYLGEITGQTASETIIEEIFKKFCVGK